MRAKRNRRQSRRGIGDDPPRLPAHLYPLDIVGQEIRRAGFFQRQSLVIAALEGFDRPDIVSLMNAPRQSRGGPEQKNQKKQDQKSDPKKQDKSGQPQSSPQDQKDSSQKQDPAQKEDAKPPEQKPGESAFGDMSKKEEPPPPPPQNTQKVGGAPEKKEENRTPADPALALPMQKLDQLRNQDSPAQLFQLMEGKPEKPAANNGKNW